VGPGPKARLSSATARRAAAVAAGLTAGALLFPAAGFGTTKPRPTLSLTASLSPNRLGKPASIGFTLRIASTAGQLPPAVRFTNLLYPQGFGIALSDLGTEQCAERTLTTKGPAACPPDSIMGRGTATAEEASPTGIVTRTVDLTVARTADRDNHIAFLIVAQGLGKGSTNVVLPALLLAARRPYGGQIRTQVPLVAAADGDGNVTLASLQLTIGPKAHLRYYERIHGRRISYIPRGIVLPNRCPRGGFPFLGEAGFAGGMTVTAHARVSCPRHR